MDLIQADGLLTLTSSKSLLSPAPNPAYEWGILWLTLFYLRIECEINLPANEVLVLLGIYPGDPVNLTLVVEGDFILDGVGIKCYLETCLTNFLFGERLYELIY